MLPVASNTSRIALSKPLCYHPVAMWLTDRAGYIGEPVRFLVRKVTGLTLRYHCWHLEFLSFCPGPYRSFK